MTPRLWQRQPGESSADFMAFVAYLRLKGRRSHRAAAAQSGRSLGAIRRLSARFNWPARVAAFEARLADASQNALDLLIHASAAQTQADYERLRISQYLLARRVMAESDRWLKLASDPRRRAVSLTQLCRITELAVKLGRLAAGMPTGDEPRRRPRQEDRPGFWTGPSFEEACAKIYGPTSPNSAPPAPSSAPPTPNSTLQAPSSAPPTPNSALQAPSSVLPAPRSALQAPSSALQAPSSVLQAPSSVLQAPHPVSPPSRRDAWSTWARIRSQAVKRQTT